ncbi:hypothetical protein DRJ00_00740 [Candidatus Aerophobetes bacterium]|uniref:Uncharacterized protein n=1 Tax=Aerophobetes bacterium TaxID=2030807 RepID=A0A497E5X7_UNCAE|nr:MAG: hypothetical protein DRJ00_00740 [Candidatus Aerophobetes bacterium]
MPKKIPRHHPLSRLFFSLTEKNFYGVIGLVDPNLVDYIAGILTDFTYVDNLYKIRDAKGRRLEDVGEMLIESSRVEKTGQFDREREIRKHIGDYTLFMTGIFPESLKRLKGSLRLDFFVDYIKAGKESYYMVSEFSTSEYRKQAPLFRRLAENFDLCVIGLNFVKKDLEALKNPDYLRAKRIIA